MESVSNAEDDETVYGLGEEKIVTGKQLLQELDELKHIDGVAKIQRKISSEISSLRKVISSKQLKINHILCSNLIHFAYLVHILRQTQNIQGVDFPIKTCGNSKSTARIDIVAENGRTWIKVIARNPKALNDIAFGRSNYGTKSILDHAISYVQGATDNQYYFKNPKIIFDFANQIDQQLESSLDELGIEVRINGQSKIKESVVDTFDIEKLNLDVTTMMAYVSSLTCDSCDWEFKEKILTEQAIKESLCSTKTFLDELFHGKELIACETAINSFLNILDVVGGPNEKNRSGKFLPSITVYPDLTENEENSLWSSVTKLQVGGKIRERTFKVIAFGIHHKALTVTANKGAIEAAKMQGINIPAIVHGARALTEQKQTAAKHVKRK